MYIFLVGIFISLALVTIYLVTRIHKMEAVKEKNTSKISWTISIIIVLVGIVLTYFIGLIVVAFMIHLAIFFIVGDIIYLLIRSGFKVNVKYNIIAIFVILITTIYIIYGWTVAQDVKETKYEIDTTKNVSDISIVEIADAHLGTTFDGNKFNEHINEISKQNPDVIVVVGDLVDEVTTFQDMVLACKALGNAKTKHGVYLVFGNHDLNTYGGNKNYTSAEFIMELKKNNVKILQDETVLVNNEFYLIGRKDKTVENRKSIEELISNINMNKYTIVLDHQPIDFQNNKKFGIDLVLCGHTHGGQLFPLKYIGEHISSNEMTYGMKQEGNTTFITTSGISVWGMPLKTDTVSEYVSIKIN